MVRLDYPPVPRQRSEEDQLAQLRADYAGQWDITRAVDCRGTPGAWYAVRQDTSRALQGVSAHDAAELRAVLTGAEQ